MEQFVTDDALIPEIDCDCVFVVHPECWVQWTGVCLYCREGGEEEEEEEEEEVQEQGSKMTGKHVLIYISIIIGFFGLLIQLEPLFSTRSSLTT